MVKRLVLSILLATGVAFGITAQIGLSHGAVIPAHVHVAGDGNPSPAI